MSLVIDSCGAPGLTINRRALAGANVDTDTISLRFLRFRKLPF